MSASLESVIAPLQVADVLAGDRVHSLYQPVVDLDTGRVVAVEALARGPEGPLHLPGPLFESAATEGLLVELEWACRAAALRGVLSGGLPSAVSLFVNVEPAQLGVEAPERVAALERAVRDRFRVVLELTERDLVRRPADVLRAVYRARAQGWGIALDDVGVDPASLALMPVVRPDVVKLDMSLIHRPAGNETARIVSAVASYAEETAASVLAEGIETDLHLERALTLGATLGQGWRFGRPAPLTPSVGRAGEPLHLIADRGEHLGTPFELVGRKLPTRVARKSQLVAMSLHLERQTADLPAPPLLLAAFEDATHFTAATAARYRDYANRSSLVAAFGVGLDEHPVAGVRGAALAASDPLAREWTVIVLGPHFAGALIARDLGDTGPDRDRRFEFALTHNRAHVTAAARCMIERIAAVT